MYYLYLGKPAVFGMEEDILNNEWNSSPQTKHGHPDRGGSVHHMENAIAQIEFYFWDLQDLKK